MAHPPRPLGYASVREFGSTIVPPRAPFLRSSDLPWWVRPAWASDGAAWEAAVREVETIVGAPHAADHAADPALVIGRDGRPRLWGRVLNGQYGATR